MLRVYRIDKSKVTSNKYFPSRLSVRLRPIFFSLSFFLFFSFPPLEIFISRAKEKTPRSDPIFNSVYNFPRTRRGMRRPFLCNFITFTNRIECEIKWNSKRERERERKIVLFLQSTITVCVYVYYRHFEYLWIQITIRKLSRFSSYKSAIFPVLFLLIKPSRNSTPFPIMRRVWSEF